MPALHHLLPTPRRRTPDEVFAEALEAALKQQYGVDATVVRPIYNVRPVSEAQPDAPPTDEELAQRRETARRVLTSEPKR